MHERKLISVNVEGAKHYERLFPFFKSEAPDVLCLQEVFERDIPQFESATGLTLRGFMPLTRRRYPTKDSPASEPWGVAILSHEEPKEMRESYFFAPADTIPEYGDDTDEDKRMTVHHGILAAIFADEESGSDAIIATLHFTWTPDGKPNQYQYEDADKLFAILEQFPSILLCGDLNAPRGHNEIYDRFAQKYTDHIPPEYQTSIDRELHRAGENLQHYMVDGLFSTPDYTARNVRLQNGVSDHHAIVATIGRQ